MALANIALDTPDLIRLCIGQPVTARVLPLHFEQNLSGVLLALFGPAADALHQVSAIRSHALYYSKYFQLRHGRLATELDHVLGIDW